MAAVTRRLALAKLAECHVRSIGRAAIQGRGADLSHLGLSVSPQDFCALQKFREWLRILRFSDCFSAASFLTSRLIIRVLATKPGVSSFYQFVLEDELGCKAPIQAILQVSLRCESVCRHHEAWLGGALNLWTAPRL